MSTRVLLAVAGRRGRVLADELEDEGIVVVAVIDPGALEEAELPRARAFFEDVDALVFVAERRVFSSDLVSACDRQGIRLVPLGGDQEGERIAQAFGLAGSIASPDAGAIAAAVGAAHVRATAESETVGPEDPGSVIVVWGPEGAPGRSTVAGLLAFELARGRTGIALIDADSHAPSTALSLGLADEGPGFPAACRQAGTGELDGHELSRISTPVRVEDGTVEVLCGINRPARWPELTADRVAAALEIARGWVPYSVVDVAAPLEQDEEVMSDIAGPRRNAAALAALRSADVIVAVAAADPIGMARFVRGYAEVRAAAGAIPVLVVANRMRPGALGLDARGQIRRTFDRFAGIQDVTFLPWDQRCTDAATLAAQPIAAVAPRSALVAAVRRFTADALLPSLGHSVGRESVRRKSARVARGSRGAREGSGRRG